MPWLVNSRTASVVHHKVKLHKQEPAFSLDFGASLGDFLCFDSSQAEQSAALGFTPFPLTASLVGRVMVPLQEQNFSGSSTWLETEPRNYIKCQPQLYSHHVMGIRKSGLNNYCLELRQ